MFRPSIAGPKGITSRVTMEANGASVWSDRGGSGRLEVRKSRGARARRSTGRPMARDEDKTLLNSGAMDDHDPLTHFDDEGSARMVDIAAKRETARSAVARGRIEMAAETLARIEAGDAAKGDVLNVARLAGIGAAKQTAQLIPLCHPVRLTRVDVSFERRPRPPAVEVTVQVAAVDRTGPEMEAVTACTAALLTIYDMCKAMDRGMAIREVVLLSKSGGASGDWRRDDGAAR